METLTKDQFQKKYGVVAASQFDQDKQQDGLFTSIKNDLANRGAENVNLLNQPSSGFVGDVAKGVGVAANTAGAVIDVAGEGLGRIPVVGGMLNSIGSAAKGAFDWASNKLSDTSLIKGAAGHTEVDSKGGTNYVPNEIGAEPGLKIAAGAGNIAEDILGADVGAGGAKMGAEAAGKLPEAAGNAATKIGEALPDVSGATNYIKSGIKDVVPSRQSVIDHNLAKALDLTPGDLTNVESSTGNSVGKFLSDNNLIGTNKETTVNLVNSFFKQNYDSVRSVIDSVKKTYTPEEVPRLVDTLKQIQSEMASVPGLEKSTQEINSLLSKKEYTLSDVQRAKEILDDQYNIYSRSGEVAAGRVKQGLANIRGEIKSFIEKEVKNETGEDIRQMNNNVATAKEIGDAIQQRSTRGLTRANITFRDVMLGAGLYAFAGPLVGIAAVFAKKLVTSPTFRLRLARYLDQISDAEKAKINATLQKGKLPPELEKFTNQAESGSPQGNTEIPSLVP